MVVNEGESLVPATTVDCQARQACRRWGWSRNGVGFRWQPEGVAVDGSPAITDGPLDVAEGYTEEEYEGHLRVPGWSREETDYLMEMCRQFSYRFVVVAERYEFASDAPRTVEDLRERYYYVRRKLAALRPSASSASAAPSPSPVPDSLLYDKEADRHYRLKLDALHRRPVETSHEELLLSEMMAQLRLVLPRVVQEREKVLLLCCRGFGNTLLAQGPSFAELAGSRSRKSSAAGPASDPSRSNRSQKSDASRNPSHRKGSLAASDTKKRRPSVSGSETWNAASVASSGAPGRKPKPIMCNTFARSQNLRTLRVGLTRHVDRMLLDLGLGVRPALPTVAVCGRFEELRSQLARLSELQKTLATLQGAASAQSAGSTSGRTESTTQSRRPSRPTSPSAGAPLYEPSEKTLMPATKRTRRE